MNSHLRDVPARHVRRDFVSASRSGTHFSVDEAILISHTLITPSDDADEINLGESEPLKETRPLTRYLCASWMQNAFLPLLVSQAVTWRSSPPV
jgi:hypothetical protein